MSKPDLSPSAIHDLFPYASDLRSPNLLPEHGSPLLEALTQHLRAHQRLVFDEIDDDFARGGFGEGIPQAESLTKEYERLIGVLQSLASETKSRIARVLQALS